MAAALCASALLAGCGGSDETKITATVTSYRSALADGDGEKACRQLTSAARRETADAAMTRTCQQYVSALADSLEDWEKQNLRNTKIARTSFKDSRLVRVTLTGVADAPTLLPMEGSELELKRSEDGDWRISGPIAP